MAETKTSADAALLSSNWYRIAALKPRLRGHVHIHRHAYRGQAWYVVEDRVAGKYHRFNLPSYRVINLMDGKRSMDTIWNRLCDGTVEDIPSQEDIISLLGQLNGADLIQCDVDPDVAELFERRAKQQRRKFMSRYLNPLALRFPLWDPDRFLDKTMRLFRPLAGWAGVAVWLAVVVPAVLLVPMHWPDLTENFTEQLLSIDNLFLAALVFPLVKAVHELSHGYVTKLKGGEVHEMGIMLLVLLPIPYVDASSASAFVDKRHRMLVGAAGMLAELFLAALAFYLWLLLEPGFARSVAYNVIVLASVTTVLFNSNPLLRYDGYYILADWLEIPNLGTRANKHWQFLADRHLFGMKQIEPPPATAGERRWFLGYAPLAFAYRMFVLFAIAMFVAIEYPVIGAVLALWALVISLGVPIYKGVAALFTQPRYAAHGPRVRTTIGIAASGFLLFLFALPMPYHTYAEGMVWLPDQAILRADGNGFVTEVLAGPGESLRPGEVVVRSYEPSLNASLAAQKARFEEVQARHDAVSWINPAHAAQIEEQLRHESAVLERLLDEAARLTLRAEASGILVMHNPDDLPGRFLKKGDIVGYLVGEYEPLVRIVVPQADADQVRLDARGIEVKFPQAVADAWPAQLIRAVPAASKELPSPVLGQVGGGEIVLDPRDSEGTKALQSLFEFELRLVEDAPSQFLGSRVHVRFEHRPEPLGIRWARDLRRLFLSSFHI